MKKNQPLVCLKNVSLTFSGSTVLENIDTCIEQGDIVAIIGPNGSGKTSLLRTIVGVYRPQQGEVINNAKSMGYVPQKLDFDRTIPVTVKEFLMIYSDSNLKTIKDTLEFVQAGKLLHKQVGALSGGELQRVLFANALLQDPELLLLDEPTAGLDVNGEQLFYRLLEKVYQEKKCTIIMVSHDIHHVFAQAKTILCLDKHICCFGSPKSVVKTKEFEALFGGHVQPYKHTHGTHTSTTKHSHDGHTH